MSAAPEAKRLETSEGEFLFIEGDPTGLAAALAEARREGLLCDAEIQCSDGGDEARHNAHRIVLAGRSDYMKALLASGRFSDSSDRIIRLPDVSFSTTAHVLHWMYGEPFSLGTVEEAVELMEAASRLQCVDLCNMLGDKLAANVKVENCVILWGLADRMGLASLANAAVESAAREYKKLVGMPDFLHLAPGMLLKLVSCDRLKIDREEDVFSSIIAWLNNQEEQVVASYIEALISYVRYPYVSKEFFSRTIDREPLLEKFPACFRAIAKTQFSCTSRPRMWLKPSWALLEKGMEIKVIDDVSKLESMCKEHEICGWNEIKHQIAGQRYDIKTFFKNSNYIVVGCGFWHIPLEAIDCIPH